MTKMTNSFVTANHPCIKQKSLNIEINCVKYNQLFNWILTNVPFYALNNKTALGLIQNDISDITVAHPSAKQI